MPMSGLVGRPLGRTAFEATLAAAVVALCGAFAQETRADTLTLAADYDNYTMGTSQSGNSGGLFGSPTRTNVMFSKASTTNPTWSAPKMLVQAGTSVYPWIAGSGSNLVVTLYHTASAALPNTVGAKAKWYESYLVSTNEHTSPVSRSG